MSPDLQVALTDSFYRRKIRDIDGDGKKNGRKYQTPMVCDLILCSCSYFGICIVIFIGVNDWMICTFIGRLEYNLERWVAVWKWYRLQGIYFQRFGIL